MFEKLVLLNSELSTVRQGYIKNGFETRCQTASHTRELLFTCDYHVVHADE